MTNDIIKTSSHALTHSGAALAEKKSSGQLFLPRDIALKLLQIGKKSLEEGGLLISIRMYLGSDRVYVRDDERFFRETGIPPLANYSHYVLDNVVAVQFGPRTTSQLVHLDLRKVEETAGQSWESVHGLPEIHGLDKPPPTINHEEEESQSLIEGESARGVKRWFSKLHKKTESLIR